MSNSVSPQPIATKTRRSRRRSAAFGVLSLFLCISPAVAGGVKVNTDSRVVPEIEWDTTLTKFQFDAEKFLGQRLTVRCPPIPVNKKALPKVHGTDAYPSDSSICVAALHAGKITRDGGLVTIQLNPGVPAYKGSDRNGVTTADLPETRRSIVFVDGSESDETKKIHLQHLPRIDWDTKFTKSGFAYRHLVGQRFTFRCPPAPSNLGPRIVYGTDTYAFASMICRAATHAGRITPSEGGIVTIEIGSGASQLVGSIRNGVETESKRGSDRSITFVDNPVDP